MAGEVGAAEAAPRRSDHRDVTTVLGCGEESVSVAIQEFSSSEWAEKVYRPDIVSKPEQIYKNPGYTM